MSERGATGGKVVAIGGGHGLAQTLRAARVYASEITAVVSVADDGGSSGRLRELLGIPAPGDLRRCIGALLPEPSPLSDALEYRFASGELTGHAFGNLLIAAFASVTGDFVSGVEKACRVLGAIGRVLPATEIPVVLKAQTAFGEIIGQVRVKESEEIATVSLVPPDPDPPRAVIEAIGEADQIVLGPGSLFTSVLAACVVPAVRDALCTRRGGKGSMWRTCASSCPRPPVLTSQGSSNRWRRTRFRSTSSSRTRPPSVSVPLGKESSSSSRTWGRRDFANMTRSCLAPSYRTCLLVAIDVLRSCRQVRESVCGRETARESDCRRGDG